MTDDPAMRRVAKRLALPERAPDEAFVARTRLALRARALVEHERRARREQAASELFAVAGLAVAAHQLLPAGEEMLALLTPLAAGAGAMAAAWALASLLLSAVAARPSRSAAPPR
jgi:hypothetical protein